MDEHLEDKIDICIAAIAQLKTAEGLAFIANAANLIAQCYRSGNKVIIAGNGGSLCDANHFAEELTGFFRENRPPLPAIALSEPGHITCVANDLGFDCIFSRGVEAYGKPGDIFAGLTTSGNSPNILAAFHKAEEMGLHTIAFLGKNGGKARGIADLELIITGDHYSDRIQEAHMTAIHLIIELVETKIFTKTAV